MTGQNSDITFTRRKFTIPEALDSVLVDLSNRHYQGNVSLCIRAAIEDHRNTLNGTDELSPPIQQLLRHLETVETQQHEIQKVIEKIEQNRDNFEDDPKHFQRRSEAMTPSMSIVFEELRTADEGLRFADLQERLGLSSSQLQRTLGSLVDRGFIVDVGTNTERFALVGTSTND